MKATNRTVLLLGLVLAAVVVGGILFLGGIRPDRPGDGGPDDVGPVARRAGMTGSPTGRASLIGTVRVAGEDAPASGLSVMLAPTDLTVLEVRTGPDGAFRFDDVDPGRVHTLTVESRGHATVRVPGIVLDPGETRDVGVLVLAPAVTVVVRVCDSVDRSLEGAVVEAHVVPGWRGVDWNKRMAQLATEPVPVAVATTGADGRVTLKGLATGRWTFVARKDGYARGGKASVRLRTDVEPDEIVLRLRPGHPLSGRVLDGEDRLLSGVTVLSMDRGGLYAMESAPIHSRTTSDEEGLYTFAAQPAGHRVLYVALEDWPPIPAAAVLIPGIDRIDLVVELGGTLRGEVRAVKTGEPIAGATINIWSQSRLGVTTVQAVTDDAGRYAFERLPSARLNGLTCRADGWVLAARATTSQLSAPAGETVVQDLEMRPGSALSGIVTSDGATLAEANVYAWFSNDRGWYDTRMARTDAEGRYAFTDLGGGRTYVTVSRSGHYQPDVPGDWQTALREGKIPDRYRVDVPREGATTFDVEMKPGVPVAGRVEGPDGEAVAGALVSCPGASTVTAGADGTFRLAVTPGSGLRVFARKDDLLTRETVTVDARPGEPVEGLVLTLAEAIRIRGRIVSASGDPLIDPRVGLHRGTSYRPRAFNVGWSARRSGFPVDADGTYEALGWATSGHFFIRAEALGHAPASSEAVEIVPGQESYQVDLTLGSGEEVRGRVTAEGAPVAGAEVGTDLTARNRRGPMPDWQRRNQQLATVAVTDADGRFVLPHLETGPCEIVVWAKDHVRARVRTEVPAPGEVAIALERSLEIRGTVAYRDGRPVPGVQLYTQAVHPDGRPDRSSPGSILATTDADGSFVLSGLRRRAYAVTAQTPWGSNDVSVKTVKSEPVVPEGPGGAPLRIVVERGETISGRVTDETGSGVPGVQVTSRLPGATTPAGWRTTMTDGDGAFRLVGLEAGAHTVSFGQGGQGGQGVSRYQAVTRSGVRTGTEGLEIVLPLALEIEGRVLDESGRPLAAGQITASALPGADGKPRPVNPSQATLEADGSFRVTGLVTGRYRLGLTVMKGGTADTGWTLVGGEDVEAGMTGLRLTASRGGLIAGVVRAGGRPVKGATVRATASGPGEQQHMAPTDENGRFVVHGLRDGVRYGVTVQARNRQLVRLPDVPGGTSDLAVDLPEGLRISGRLLDARGKPAPEMNLYLSRGAERAWGQTNARGEFSIGGLTEGTYRTTSWSPTTRQMISIGEVEAGAAGLVLRLPE